MKTRAVRYMVSSVLVLFLAFNLAETEVHAGGIYATEWTQIFNNLELGKIDAQSLEQLAQQIQQTTALIRQAKNLDFALYSDVFNDIKAVEDVVRAGQGLAYSMANLDSEWNTRFHTVGYTDTRNYPGLYKNWAQTSMDSVRGTMNAVTGQGQRFASDADMVRRLQESAKQNVQGSLQAEQMLTQISAQMLGEMQKLRQLMLADLQSKEAWQAQQIQEGMATRDLVQPDKLFEEFDLDNLAHDRRTFPDDYVNAIGKH